MTLTTIRKVLFFIPISRMIRDVAKYMCDSELGTEDIKHRLI